MPLRVRPLEFSGGFVSPPTPRDKVAPGVVEMQNLCLAPGGTAMQPFPGMARAYAYPMHGHATAYRKIATGIITYHETTNPPTPAEEYELAREGFRIVSFPSVETMQTGPGRGLAVVDEATGRVVGLIHHPGGVPIDMSQQGNWTPLPIGRMERYGEYDYPAVLNTRRLTHFASDFDEHYVFDGTEYRLAGMRAPHWPPVIDKRDDPFIGDTVAAQYGAASVIMRTAPRGVLVVKVFGAWNAEGVYRSPALTYNEYDLFFWEDGPGKVPVRSIGDNGRLDIEQYATLGALRDAIAALFPPLGDPATLGYGWVIEIGNGYSEADPTRRLEQLSFRDESNRFADVQDPDKGTVVYAASANQGESKPGVFYEEGRHGGTQRAWKSKQSWDPADGFALLGEGVPNYDTLEVDVDGDGNPREWLPRIDWGVGVRDVSIITFRQSKGTNASANDQGGPTKPEIGALATPVMYYNCPGGFIPGGVTQIRLRGGGVGSTEDLETEVVLVFEKDVDVPGPPWTGNWAHDYHNYWLPSSTGVAFRGTFSGGSAILEFDRDSAPIPSEGYTYKTVGLHLHGGLYHTDSQGNTLEESRWKHGNTTSWLPEGENNPAVPSDPAYPGATTWEGYKWNPFWPNADPNVSPPYLPTEPAGLEQGYDDICRWMPQFPQWSNSTAFKSGPYLGFIIDSMQFLGGGGGGEVVEPGIIGHGTIIVNATPDTGSWVFHGPDGQNRAGTGDATYTEMPAGNYYLLSDELEGYTPSSVIIGELTGGGTLTFNPTWIPVGGAVGTVSIATNIESGPWSLSGGITHSGTGSYSNAAAPAGAYTVTCGEVAGYTTPVGGQQTLSPGGTVSFNLVWTAVGDDPSPGGEDPLPVGTEGSYAFGMSWYDGDLDYESAMSPIQGRTSWHSLNPNERFCINVSGAYKVAGDVPVYARNSAPTRATAVRIYVTRNGWAPVDAATPQYRLFLTVPLDEIQLSATGEQWITSVTMPPEVDDYLAIREMPVLNVGPPVRAKHMVTDGDRVLVAGQRDYSVGRVKYTKGSRLITNLVATKTAGGVEDYQDWPSGYWDETAEVEPDIERQAIWGPHYEGDSILLGGSARPHLVKMVLPGISTNLLKDIRTDFGEAPSDRVWDVTGPWAIDAIDARHISVTGDAEGTVRLVEETGWTPTVGETYIVVCSFYTRPHDEPVLVEVLLGGKTVSGGGWTGGGTRTYFLTAADATGMKIKVTAAAEATVVFTQVSVHLQVNDNCRELLLDRGQLEANSEATYTIKGQPSRVWWTSVDAQRGPDREGMHLLNYLDLDMPGDEIQGLVKIGQWVVAVGKNHLAWLGQDYGSVDGYSLAFPRPRTEIGTGTISGRTIVPMDGSSALWLSPAGKLIQVSEQGVQVLPISDRFKGYLSAHERVTLSELRHAHGVFLPVQNWFVLCLPGVDVSGTDTEKTGLFGTWTDRKVIDRNIEET